MLLLIFIKKSIFTRKNGKLIKEFLEINLEPCQDYHWNNL